MVAMVAMPAAPALKGRILNLRLVQVIRESQSLLSNVVEVSEEIAVSP